MNLRRLFASALPVTFAFAACGGETAGGPSAHLPPPTTASVAATTPPPPKDAKPTIDESALDKSVAPCDDFYQHACGTWLKTATIPDDRPAWGRAFDTIYDKNELVLKAILERDAAGNGEGAYAKELGDLYATCMDEAAIEKAGLDPLKDELSAIARVHDAKSLTKEIARLQKMGVGAALDFDSQIDAKDATQVIAALSQGGLGLPERDYYFPKKEDERKQKLLAAYEQHVAAILELAGDKPADAKKHAKQVLRIETELARASMTNTELRDPQKTYHKLDRKQLKELAKSLAWDDFFAEIGAPGVESLNVAQPDFTKALGALVTSAPIDEWRTYLRWHLVQSSAGALSAKFVDESFKWSQTLSGVKQLPPRWKRCVNIADRLLGEALAQPFVKETLGAEGKATAQQMVAGIEDAMRANLEQLAWMDDATRKLALEKLAQIRNKIAFPEKWRSYDGIGIDRASYFKNRAAGFAFEAKRRLAKIGKPVDKAEWVMTPPTVNAYYEPTLNEIVFPAGILQPPFFASAQTRAMNFGAIGMVIGHEITHGFDDEGRQYDALGNLKDWWTPSVSTEFDKRAKCIEEQYDAYVPIDDLHIKGKLTLGENIADHGGLKLAYAAFQKAKAAQPSHESYAYTEEQQFFLGYAQSWCEAMRDDFLRLLVSTNPHSPSKFRVNGPLSNMKEFAAAFSCKPGDKMVRASRCEVW